MLTARTARCWALWMRSLRLASQSAYPSGGSVSAGTLSGMGQVCQQRPEIPEFDSQAVIEGRWMPVRAACLAHHPDRVADIGRLAHLGPVLRP
jgi:hypothetical protein